jgi:hypothetical protein
MTPIFLNFLNIIAGLLISAGVAMEYGPGWALVTAGIYLAYNVITTSKVLNVRPDEES